MAFEYVSFGGSPAVAEDAAAVREGVAAAYVANAANQAEAERFLRENGAAVIPGHGDVGAPGRMGDADVGLDASDT